MTRTGTFQKGQFNVKNGMVFLMPELKILDKRSQMLQSDTHPWLITQVYDDYIEMVMCTTTTSNIENKHRIHRLNYDNQTDIRHPCPPMDKPEIRIQSVSLDTAMLLPKKELFSHKIKLCNESTEKYNLATHGMDALCLRKTDLSYIRKELAAYQKDHRQLTYDPFLCEDQESYLYDLEEGYTVPDWFTKEKYNQQFAWKHLPKADWKAVYPFKDQMHDYEKQYDSLLEIAELKSGKSKNRNKTQLPHTERVRKAKQIQQRTIKQNKQQQQDIEFK